MIAPTCIIAGLGMSLGIGTFWCNIYLWNPSQYSYITTADIVTAPGATGDYHTNLRSKAEVLVKTITDECAAYTFGFLHVKAVDDAGHDKNVSLKVDFLERIDRDVWPAIHFTLCANRNLSCRFCSTLFLPLLQMQRQVARSMYWLSQATIRLLSRYSTWS